MGLLRLCSARRGGCLLVVVGLLLAVAGSRAVEAATGPRKASIVVDYRTGAILQASNADAAVYPASLTKAMTLYLLFERLRAGKLTLDSKLKVSSRAAAMSPSRLGLRAGSTIAVKDAIMALITKSANDVAVVVAEALAGSEADFARRMTERARALGMSRTTFRNASGLPDNGQRTTARDMARLGVRMIRDFPEYYGWFKTRQYTYHNRALRNHNGLLHRYEGLDGLKTGFIRASGFNLLASATRGDERLVAAVFGGATARARDDAMAKLLDRGFAELRSAGNGKGRLGDQPIGPDEGDTLVVAGAGAPPSAGQGDMAGVAKGLSAHTRPASEPAVAARAVAAKPASRPIYAVQVGAFRTKTQAQQAAAIAAKKAPEHLRGRATTLKPTRSRGRTLYRAWLTGLSQAQAAAACRQLKAARHDCLVVRS
jgi:D-alanyl-D-alanine carboxypeptidase